jgi:lysine-specific demethylase/histidyl-hydroxylase NO66
LPDHSERVRSGGGSRPDQPHPPDAKPTLARLLPIDVDKFAADYWGRAPLLARGAELPAPQGAWTSAGFADLLTLADVDEIVSRRGLRTPFIRVAKGGTVVDSTRYTGSGGTGAEIADQVIDDRILELFADGSTVVLQALHRLWPPLIQFASGLSADLGHPVQINAYITPARSQGFSAHYDVHDVFVIQVHGTKSWRIHRPVVPDPLRDQPWSDYRTEVERRATEPPLIEAVLEPGDVLYLPRGYLHSATALGDVSAHLTVGVHPVTRYAIVEALTKLAADDPQLRSSLPLGFDLGSDLAAQLAETVEQLVVRVRRADVADVEPLLVRSWLPAAKPAPISPIAQAVALHALTVDDAVQRRPALRYTIAIGDQVVLRLTSRTLRLPLATAPAVRALLSGDRFRVGDLPGLDPDDAIVLVRRLLKEAVVVPASSAE